MNWIVILECSLMWMSILCMVVLFTLYVIFKPLRTHPGELLMISSFCYAYNTYHIFTRLHLFTTLSDIQTFIGFFFGSIWNHETKYIVQLVHGSISIIIGDAYQYYEMILCLDLALAIYLPFYTPSNRNKYYHLVYLLLLCISLVYIMCAGKEVFLLKRHIFSTMIVDDIIYITLLAITVVSMIYFGIKARSAKIVDTYINSLIVRYFIYGVMFVLDMACNIVALYFIRYMSYDDRRVYRIMNIYYDLQFILFFLLRITEPCTYKYLIFKIKYSFIHSKHRKMKLKGDIIKYEQWLLNTNSIFMLLHEKLSAQLIECMLKGITHIEEKGNINPKRAKKGFKFKEYSPKIFTKIRKDSGITHEILLNSLCPILNKKTILQARKGEGKSGSFFFYSHNRRFMIKIIQKGEQLAINKMLKDYLHHLSTNGESHLLRILSMFTVKINGLARVYGILVPNIFCIHGHIREMKYVFDLKGSTINRYTVPIPNKKQTLKDMNFRLMKRRKQIIVMGPNVKHNFFEHIATDVAFLSKQGLMDYSLLMGIGVEHGVYISSIIDYTQHYNWKKKLEYLFRSILNPLKSKQYSCINPKKYSRRFMNFIFGITSRHSSKIY